MTFETLAYAVENGVAHIRLNRPDAFNVMIEAFWRDMRGVFAAIDTDKSVHAAVISAAGRFFTAGIDLAFFSQLPAGDDKGRNGYKLLALVEELQESFNVIDRCRVPVIAAVQGGCIGGGVDLVSACDFRYCAKDAYFTVAEVNVGIVADLGTLQRLPRVMPDGLARRICYTGEKLDAARAQACGFVTEVFDTPEALVEGALATAREIAAKSPLAVAGIKEMLGYMRDHTTADALRHVALWQAAMWSDADVQGSIAAMKAKCPPVYKDID